MRRKKCDLSVDSDTVAFGKSELPAWAARFVDEHHSVYQMRRGSKVYYLLYETGKGKPIYVGSISETRGFRPVTKRKGSIPPPECNDPLTEYAQSETGTFEYGFSRTLLTLGMPLCVQSNPICSKDTLFSLIVSISPDSYLTRTHFIPQPMAERILERKLNRQLGVSIRMLYQKLCSIRLIVEPERVEKISHISEEQQELFQKYHVQIGGTEHGKRER